MTGDVATTGTAGILWGLAGVGLGISLGWWLSHGRLRRRLVVQERALQQARNDARTDPLTKLWNRAAFDEQIRLWTAVCRRYGGSVALILFDLDAFKQINDRNGHAVGDAALVQLADILRDTSRESDICARVGGDEFALLLPHTGIDGARTLAERIRSRVESSRCSRSPDDQRGAGQFSHRSPDGAVDLRVSVGISEYQVEQSPARFVEQADQALYRAKQSGGNRVATSVGESLAGQRPSDRSIR